MGCSCSKAQESVYLDRPNPSNPLAKFETSRGTFSAEIFLDRVPRTASNFIDLVKSGFYNGIHFHRVIPGFMCQFGCPYAKDPKAANSGTGGPEDGQFVNMKNSQAEQRTNGGCIRDEHASKDSNKAGTLSMASTGKADSGGSQFFLNVAHNDFLDWFTPGDSRHTVFGMVRENYECLVDISKVKTNGDTPTYPIVMKQITVE